MNLSFKNIVPENKIGKQTDVEHSISTVTYEEALKAFNRATMRMLNINIWHKLGGFASAQFYLTNAVGENVDRLAVINDYIKIDIHGPGPLAGEGFDWVKIEAIDDNSIPEDDEESMAIRVRSSKHPGMEGKDIAHFFTSDATSTFIIHRHQNTITSFYHGRNEVLNVNTEKLRDNIRNVIMGGVALAGVSEMQWSALIKSFLEAEV